MPIDQYHGDTFVAYIDISGFKVMMKDRERARDALSTFFQTGYTVLREQRNAELQKRIDGLFVSDCGVLFSRFNGAENSDEEAKKDALSSMLSVIERISTTLLEAELMLTGSVAYGRFDFDERVEFSGVVKNMMFGYAYLNAYLDNEAGKPKLSPGQCRILTENLDDPFLQSLHLSQAPPFDRVKKHSSEKKHLYFYWMVRAPFEIPEFDRKYNDTYNLKYRGMLKVLREFAVPGH